MRMKIIRALCNHSTIRPEIDAARTKKLLCCLVWPSVRDIGESGSCLVSAVCEVFPRTPPQAKVDVEMVFILATVFL